uniref:Uncharacterized protein n=1 Tax=Rhizophora mucronata TaxID=61149 RepID=A0A2P2P9X0_RHIMU
MFFSIIHLFLVDLDSNHFNNVTLAFHTIISEALIFYF